MINLQQQQKLGWILSKAAAAAPGALSKWEAGFVADMAKRFERYGERIKISEKQWAVLDRICEEAAG